MASVVENSDSVEDSVDLWCWVYGYRPDTIFTMTIRRDAIVNNLRKSIATKIGRIESRQIDESLLVLWKVSSYRSESI